MDRCTRNSIITSFQNYHDSDFWQHHTPTPPNHINTLSMLSRNLLQYQKAYRSNHPTQHPRKHSNNNLSFEKRPSRNSLSFKRSYSTRKVGRNEKGRKIVVNDIENRDQNNNGKGERSSMDIKVKNVQFNRDCKEYKKKRDRYREIFGQRPRYILKKIKTESLQVR